MSAHDELVGGTWRWRGPDAGSPASRDAYTLEFLPDGRVVVRADCNRGSGRYATGANATLALSGIATTKVACPAGSLDAAFLHDLAAVERYRFDGDTLVLMLRGDARTLRFSR